MRQIVMWLPLIALGFLGCGASDGMLPQAPPPPQAMDLPAGAGEQKPDAQHGAQRQIVYKADLSLTVGEFSPVPQQIAELAASHEGFVADSHIEGSPGTARRGRWTVRVPPAKFAGFVESVSRLGEMTRLDTDSDDVSSEYYDVEARIRNRQKEETRLLQLLEGKTGKLEDVLTVERELSRVREEIERMEGRLNVLKDLVSLSTVTIRVDEIRGFTPVASPTLATRIGRAWQSSLSVLQSAGEALVVAAVAASPWLVVAALPILAALVIVRRVRQRQFWIR